MPDSTSIEIIRRSFANDLYSTLNLEYNKILNHYELYYSVSDEIIQSCADLTGSYDNTSLENNINLLASTIDGYIPMLENDPSYDNNFLDSVNYFYNSMDLSGITTPVIKYLDKSGSQFNETFLFYNSENIITGACATILNDFTGSEFIIAAYISGLNHNTVISNLYPNISNAHNIYNLLESDFSDLINISDASDLIANIDSNLNDLYILSGGALDISSILSNISDTSRADYVRDITYIFDVFYSSIYSQLVTNYNLSESNYKINITNLKVSKPLP